MIDMAPLMERLWALMALRGWGGVARDWCAAILTALIVTVVVVLPPHRVEPAKDTTQEKGILR